MKIPSSVGEAVDLLYKERAKRLKVEEEVKALKFNETTLKNHILSLLEQNGLEGAKGHAATAAIIRTEKAVVNDWDELHQYIIENDAWELMHKRTSITALSERWQNGEEVPGVTSYEATDLSLTKAGG